MRKAIRTILYRRKLAGKTNYLKRLGLLKSSMPRIVVRPSLKNITVQIISYTPTGDKIIASANSLQLKKLGWKASCSNLSAAYLTGLLAGRGAKGAVKEAILDAGFIRLTKGNRMFAALKGVVDAGIVVPVGKEMFPLPARISGKHVEDYAKKIAGSEKYAKQFSLYLKQGVKPEELTKHFEDIKSKIK
jgi:large subunit ribosomal protein L18